ncbi:hypothetical protein [Litchfieldia salsa]|uniref:Nucleotidase n=1 Tax=Litchfieldia salsa TaxID=930152 RepID=A0A1H0VB55_9BACI|nr:hypothetical protein [Litchfieldia salsa]SDP75584.1 hypothetical protein SAMN05216565_106147 [Litchfieldia salsa]
MAKKFGIDIDGTLTSPSTFVPYINESFNMNITIDDMKEYNLLPLLGINEKQFWEWMDKKEPIIYKDSPLASHAKMVIDEWKELHDLIYISARRNHLFDITESWFKENSISYQHIELIGSHDKISAVQKHGIDLFFEDKHDNACDISEECKIPVILFNTPYNQDPIPKNVIRVNNWLEAKQWVSNWTKIKV